MCCINRNRNHRTTAEQRTTHVMFGSHITSETHTTTLTCYARTGFPNFFLFFYDILVNSKAVTNRITISWEAFAKMIFHSKGSYYVIWCWQICRRLHIEMSFCQHMKFLQIASTTKWLIQQINDCTVYCTHTHGKCSVFNNNCIYRWDVTKCLLFSGWKIWWKETSTKRGHDCYLCSLTKF